MWEGEQIAPDTAFLDLPGDHVVRYLFAKRFVNNKVVLDDCCGSGYGSTFLAENGSKFVIGLDISDAATTFAQNQYKLGNLNFTKQDATRLAFADKGFDVIVSFEAVEHIKEYRKYLGEIVRCLKDDGIYVMSTPNKLMTSPIWKTPYNHWHVQEFRPVELKHHLEDFFSDVELLGEHSYNDKWNRMESRYKIANFVHPILLRRLPRRIKDLYLGISLAKERVKSTDWTIDKLDINHSYCIVAICRSPKREKPVRQSLLSC